MGRPKKYTTEAERRAASKQYSQRYRDKKSSNQLSQPSSTQSTNISQYSSSWSQPTQDTNNTSQSSIPSQPLRWVTYQPLPPNTLEDVTNPSQGIHLDPESSTKIPPTPLPLPLPKEPEAQPNRLPSSSPPPSPIIIRNIQEFHDWYNRQYYRGCTPEASSSTVTRPPKHQSLIDNNIITIPSQQQMDERYNINNDISIGNGYNNDNGKGKGKEPLLNPLPTTDIEDIQDEALEELRIEFQNKLKLPEYQIPKELHSPKVVSTLQPSKPPQTPIPLLKSKLITNFFQRQPTIAVPTAITPPLPSTITPPIPPPVHPTAPTALSAPSPAYSIASSVHSVPSPAQSTAHSAPPVPSPAHSTAYSAPSPANKIPIPIPSNIAALPFEQDIPPLPTSRSLSAEAQTTNETTSITLPLPVHIFLIKALKGLPGCSIQQHEQQRNSAKHSELHRDPRTSIDCHCIQSITSTLEGKPLTNIPRISPALSSLLSDIQNYSFRLREETAVITHNSNTTLPDLTPLPVATTSGPPLPSALHSTRIGIKNTADDLNCQQAFEGSGNGGVPPRLCMPIFYDQSSTSSCPFLVSYDVDSILGFASSCAIAKQGLRWFPAMNIQMNITSNIHLGIPVPPPIATADTQWQPQPLHLIPHYALGQILGWDSMLLFIVFPRLFKHPLPSRAAHQATAPGRMRYEDELDVYEYVDLGETQPDDYAAATATATATASASNFQRKSRYNRAKESLLSSEQIRIWVDDIFLPALYEAIATDDHSDTDGNGTPTPDSNILQHIPQSYQAAVNLTKAQMETAATSQYAHKKHQNVGLTLHQRHLNKLTPLLRQTTASDPRFEPFRDFQFFFNTKNTKLEFMRSGNGSGTSSFLQVMEDFSTRWEQAFDHQHYADDSVWVDIGKQVTSRSTSLPSIQPLPVHDTAEVFLWRQCCLEKILQSRHDWIRACRNDAHQNLANGDTHIDGNGEGSGNGDGDGDGDSTQQAPREQHKTNYRLPTVAWYPWAMVDGVSSMTITSAPCSMEQNAGLVYSQWYNLIKAPFDAQKHYALQPPVYENLALDPLYLQQLRQEGRGTIVNQAVAKNGYIQSKKRAALNLAECSYRSFGVRNEDRISLALLHDIVKDWDTTTCDNDIMEAQIVVQSMQNVDSNGVDTATATTSATASIQPTDAIVAMPWYAIPTPHVLQFLSAQINRHCLLFEHILNQTDLMFSFEETVPMIIALRGLRYCYSSNLLHQEPLLFRDNWRQEEWTIETTASDSSIVAVSRPRVGRPPKRLRMNHDDQNGSGNGNGSVKVIDRVGLGLRRSMQRHGFGWWRPDIFEWDFWRFKGDICQKLLVGNILLHDEYRRRWRAIKEIRNSTIYMFQARQWYRKYNLAQNLQLRQVWLDYMHCLVLRQFDLDVWDRLHTENTKYEELRDSTATAFPRSKPPPFCYSAMRELFYDRGAINSDIHLPPHLLSGNRSGAAKNPKDIISTLFGINDKEQRRGWSAMKYRGLTQRAYQAISDFMSEQDAQQWLNQLFRLALLTHWLLPYPSATAFFSTTKAVAHKNMHRRTIWVSSMLCQWTTEEFATEKFRAELTHRDLTGILRKNRTDPERKGEPVLFEQEFLTSQIESQRQWQITDLLEATEDLDASHDFAIGRISLGGGGNAGRMIPIVERGTPPVLAYATVMVGKSIEEMDTWFVTCLT